MKKLILGLILMAGFSLGSQAQQKALQTVKIKTPTVQCEMCKKRIEDYVKTFDGVTYVNVNYKKKETTVKYLTDRSNIEIVKTAIANAGYDADDVEANPDSYKALPSCCKKPDDGNP